MKILKNIIFVLFLCCLLSRCASTKTRIIPQFAGIEASEARKIVKDVTERYENIMRGEIAEIQNVKIYSNSFSIEGLTYSAADHKTDYTEGYDHKFLGEFQIMGDNVFWPNYRSDARKMYCRPNNVLTLATLLMWYVVPFNWACFPGGTTPEEQENDIKVLANLLGGDLVLMPKSSVSQQGNVMLVTNRTGIIWKMDEKVKAKMLKK